MSVSVVAHIGFVSTFGSTGSATSSSINTTGATFLLAAHSHYGGSSFSDNKGNTWTTLRAGNYTSQNLKLYIAVNPIVGSGHTFTVTNGFASACIVAMTGLYSVQDLATGAPANSVGSATSLATAAFTPKYDNSMIVTALSLNNSVTSSTGMAVNGVFSITDTGNQIVGQGIGVGLAWQQQSTASSVTPTWTWTNNSDAIIECLVFATTPSAGGGGETSSVFG